jgi:hypothetical protein
VNEELQSICVGVEAERVFNLLRSLEKKDPDLAAALLNAVAELVVMAVSRVHGQNAEVVEEFQDQLDDARARLMAAGTGHN